MIIGWSCARARPDAGVWPSAGTTTPDVNLPANAPPATAPSVNPPANAPPFRSSLRLVLFEPIGLSFEIEPISLSYKKPHYHKITSPHTTTYHTPPNLASAHEQGLADS